MDLPLNRDQAHVMAGWIKTNFGTRITQELTDTPFNLDIACAIACQETGIYLVRFIKTLSVDDALGRCVFDASGDYPGTTRSAFPRNTGIFREAYGGAFTDMLIDEANKMRKERGFSPATWVYKGYGIFQYDLQYVKKDQAFFENRKWYDFGECLSRLKSELMRKFAAKQDVMLSIQAYNGSGPRSEAYLENVKHFITFCSEV